MKNLDVYQQGFRDGLFFILKDYTCRCAEEYKERRLIDPNCVRCDIWPPGMGSPYEIAAQQKPF